MSTLKNLVKKFAVVGLVTISFCSCSEANSKVSDGFKENTSRVVTYETATKPNTVSTASTVFVEKIETTTTTSGILEATQTTESLQTTTQNTKTSETVQTTQTSQATGNKEVTSITTVSNLPGSTTFVTNQVELDSNSLIFWQYGFQYYKVQPDDSWTSIADYLEVDKTQLAAANDRTLDDIVVIGEGLFIPNEYIDYTQQSSAIPQNNVQSQADDKPPVQNQNNSGQFIGSGIVYSAPDNASWTNIAQAVADINGLTLAPGEYFSWNNYVGWKTAQYVNPETGSNDWGYVEAPVIDGTEPGGGICVVSTTLNKAARACGIDTVKCPHSRPVSYASGDDEAAVDYSSKDLSFSNPYDYTIVFYATCSYGVVTINCYVA